MNKKIKKMKKEKRKNPSELAMTKKEGEDIIFSLENVRKNIIKEIRKIRLLNGEQNDT